MRPKHNENICNVPVRKVVEKLRNVLYTSMCRLWTVFDYCVYILEMGLGCVELVLQVMCLL